MAEKGRQIFRQQSLEKLSSPERLDQMLRIVKPQSWLLLFAVSVGACLVVVWAIFGMVPETAHGPGILVVPQQVTEFHSPADGQIKSIEVFPGDEVQAGALLAKLDLPTLEKDLEMQEEKLALVMEHGRQRTAMEEELARQERGVVEGRRALNQRLMERVQTAADRYREGNESYIAERRRSLVSAREELEPVAKLLEDQLSSLNDLIERGIDPVNQRIRPLSDLVEIRVQLVDLTVTEEALSLRESEVEEYYDQRMDIIREIAIETNDLAMQEVRIERRLQENRLQYDRELQEVQQAIDRLKVQLEDGELRSEHAGRVLEITAAVGHEVAVGQSLGKMMIRNPDAALMAVAYLSIEDGKKVELDQEIRVSPATFERERYGSIIGRVESVSEYPVTIEAATHEIGDREIASDLLAGQARIEVKVRLERDPSTATTYKWTSPQGPPGEPPTPGTTAEVRVTLEERAPITLVLPFLRKMFGQ